MYGQQGAESGYYGNQYHDDENYNANQYGHNYRNYRMMNDQPSIKGKIEQKFWKTKQKAIEKLGKGQDEFVIAGDAEVDARLEAFHHIKLTCMQLMAAIECYQNKIFALSQDENEMGRFLKDQGALDKTKAGKMMIAVGKAQSFAAQQRLGLRSSLARLYSEIETFRFRAIQDTQITVSKMEQSRTEYRAGLLWMADISKELDPDQFKRLDKFRDVQVKVKQNKKLFDKLKGDVIQKIDLLSASRCNLLSATLEPYQSSMVKFLKTTAKSYNKVYEEYKGHPSYKFNILKNIIPNNGIVDDDDDDDALLDPAQKGDNADNKDKKKRQAHNKPKRLEKAEEAKPEEDSSNTDDGDDDKLISFDTSPSEEGGPAKQDGELIGGFGDEQNETSPSFGDYTKSKEDSEGFEDLLGKFEENNIPPSTDQTDSSDPFALISSLDTARRNESDAHSQPEGSFVYSQDQNTAGGGGGGATVDDLLFGSPSRKLDGSEKTDIDILSDVLTNQSLGITDTESQQNNSFSDQWQSMFGGEEGSGISALDMLASPAQADDFSKASSMVEATNIKSDRMYMPSFLLEQMRQKDPQALKNGPPKSALSLRDSSKLPATAAPAGKRKGGEKSKSDGMSAWFDLFADLDPLANPDEVGATQEVQNEKQAC